eukprot:gene5309-19030_t
MEAQATQCARRVSGCRERAQKPCTRKGPVCIGVGWVATPAAVGTRANRHVLQGTGNEVGAYCACYMRVVAMTGLIGSPSPWHPVRLTIW